MSSAIYAADTFGNIIEVQCKITKGLPSVQIVGLAGKSIDEAKDRVRAAFHSSNLEFPKGRVLVNLSPADLPKEGSSYDLPIALSILQESGIIRAFTSSVFAIGELSLDGSIEPIRGIIGRLSAKFLEIGAVVVPSKNYAQAVKSTTHKVVPVSSLREFIDILNGTKSPSRPSIKYKQHTQASDESFSEVKGQQIAKRALILSASGRHNVLLYGPPGTGKSMLAKALVSLLPDLTDKEQLETTHLHSLKEHIGDELVVKPPLRAPHHSSSSISLLGGGSKAKPGEISLAHNGVLFLDELLEFPRNSIEALRQPLEDREIHIARAEHSVTYPASFIMIATMNPCPCGNLGSTKPCTCLPHAIESYRKRLSGPLLDRIDLCIKVDEVPIDSLLDEPAHESLDALRNRIKESREIQLSTRKKYNSELTNKDLRKVAMAASAKALLDQAAIKMQLSPRAYFRTLRVAQTICDLDGRKEIISSDVAESLQYRQLMAHNY